jgi:hypothetical protein
MFCFLIHFENSELLQSFKLEKWGIIAVQMIFSHGDTKSTKDFFFEKIEKYKFSLRVLCAFVGIFLMDL